MPRKSRFDEVVDGLYVQQRGEGVPLLLLNGLGAHHRMWSPFVDDLVGPTVVFDWPGTGRSPARAAPRSMAEFVAVAEGVAKRLGHARIDVLGFSFGGAVALHLALARPDLVRRLVLVSSTLGVGSVVGPPAALATIATPLRYYSPSYHSMTSHFASGGRYEQDPKFRARSAEVRRLYRPNAAAYFGQLMALTSSSILERLADVDQPALVVHGTSDPIVPTANAYLLAHKVPAARLLLVEDGGHMLLQYGMPWLAPAVSDFLAADGHMSSATWTGAQTVTAEQMRDVVRRSDCGAAQPMGFLSAVARSALL